MGKFFENISDTFKSHKNIVLIVTAAILLQLISTAQYFYVHNILEEQLDFHAESELRVKAILTRNLLYEVEKTMEEHLWDINQNLPHADSMFNATARLIEKTPQAIGSCVAFVPNYYPDKDRLFEPYAHKENNKIVITQVATENTHDYTKHPAFVKVENDKKPFWSEPYKSQSTVMSLTTYSYPLLDSQGNLIAVGGIDLSLKQIGDTLNARHIYPSSFDLLLTRKGDVFCVPSDSHSKSHDIEQVVRLINDSTVKRESSKSGLSKIITFESEIDGENAYIYYGSIKGDPKWQIAVVCYNKEVYGDLLWFNTKMFFLTLLGFAFLAFIIQRYARNEKRLNQAKIEQEKIGSELRIAKDIQKGMLPKKKPVLPERKDFLIYGSLVPAKEVGGDLYDYFLRDEKLFFCIGDVSGKGIPSAIIMSGIHYQFRLASMHENNPAHIMQTLNTTSCEGNDTNIFITLFIGVLDLPTGRLRYCNAGHDVPYIISEENEHEVSQPSVNANIPIGLFDDFKFKCQETQISNGTTIFLYTDGLTEAKNNSHKMFGTKRIEKVLSDFSLATPKELIGEVKNRVREFMEDAERSDDLTILSIKYTPPKEEFTGCEQITLQNKVSEIKKLNSFVKSVTDNLNIETSHARNIKLAVEEAVVNVIDYAYPIGKDGDINVKAMYHQGKLKFVISDSGSPFDPTEATVADTTLTAEERPIGGLGLLLVRELMDSINYERIDKKNILTLNTHYTESK